MPPYIQIPKSPFSFCFHCSKPYKIWMAGAIAGVSIAILLSRVSNYLIKIILDLTVEISQNSASIQDLWFWIFAYPTLFLLNESFWRCGGFCGMRWVTGVISEAYTTLFAYLTDHSSSYFSDRYAGSITNKISNAAKGSEELIGQCLWGFYNTLLGLFLDLILTGFVHIYFTYIILGWTIIYLYVNYLLVRKLRAYAYQYAQSSSLLKGKIVDSTTNIDIVKYSGESEYEKNYINGFINEQKFKHLREWTTFEWILATNAIMITILILSVFSLGAKLIEYNTITIGSFVLVITTVTALQRNLFFIGQLMARVINNYSQIKEGLDDLLLPHEIKNSQNSVAPDKIVGDISFKNIEFNYGGNKLFNNFNLDIKAGEKIGLIGRSGAGKSSLVSLLLRNFDVLNGEITVDDYNIKELDLNKLRSSIALVPQTTSLFHRSIIENIRYGKLDATDEEVVKAAKLAEADSFIKEFPEGYN